MVKITQNGKEINAEDIELTDVIINLITACLEN